MQVLRLEGVMAQRVRWFCEARFVCVGPPPSALSAAHRGKGPRWRGGSRRWVPLEVRRSLSAAAFNSLSQLGVMWVILKRELHAKLLLLECLERQFDVSLFGKPRVATCGTGPE